MIIIEKTKVMGFEHAIRGMRNPMNSWDKSDSCFCPDEPVCEGNCPIYIGPNDLALMRKLAKGGSVHAKYRRMIAVYVDVTAPLYWWKEFDTYKVGTVANSCSTMHKIGEKEFTIDDFSHEHLTCMGVSTRTQKLNPRLAGMDSYERLMEEPVHELSYDWYGALLATIHALNGARQSWLKRKDKQYWWQMIQLLPSSYNQKRTLMLNYEVLAGLYPHRREHKLDEWLEFCKWIEGLPYSGVITCNAVAGSE